MKSDLLSLSRILLLSLVLAPLCLLAQTESDEIDAEDAEPEIPQYYQVELIVFRHLDQSGTTAEIPRMPEREISELLEQDLARLSGRLSASDTTLPGDSGNPALVGPIDTHRPLTEPAETADVQLLPEDALPEGEVIEPEENTGPPFIINVAEEQLLLAETAIRMDVLAPYELVSYLHWAQPAPDAAEARQLDLLEVGANPELVGGNIEVHQRRYLHLLIDISLGEGLNKTEFPDQDMIFLPEISDTMPAIKDSRRIRLEQLHYFDQPQFGLLAVISRYEFPEEVPVGEESDEDALPEDQA